MCTNIIIDTNMFSLFLPESDNSGKGISGENKSDQDENGEMNLLRNHIDREHFTLVYTSDTNSKYYEEIQRMRKASNYIIQLRRRGSLELVNKERLASSSVQLSDKVLQSDDRHILELALAASVEVICTNDDDLEVDFLNKDILPNVRQGRQRTVYPHKSPESNQRKFLNRWKCPE